MLVLEFGHDKDLVCPVDQFLGDSLRCKSVRACGLRFVLFRVAEEVLRSRAAVAVAGADEKQFGCASPGIRNAGGARLGSVYAHLDPYGFACAGFASARLLWP